MEEKTNKSKIFNLFKERKIIVLTIIFISVLFPFVISMVYNAELEWDLAVLVALICLAVPVFVTGMFGLVNTEIFRDKNIKPEAFFYVFIISWLIWIAYLTYALITGDVFF